METGVLASWCRKPKVNPELISLKQALANDSCGVSETSQQGLTTELREVFGWKAARVFFHFTSIVRSLTEQNFTERFR